MSYALTALRKLKYQREYLLLMLNLEYVVPPAGKIQSHSIFKI